MNEQQPTPVETAEMHRAAHAKGYSVAVMPWLDPDERGKPKPSGEAVYVVRMESNGEVIVSLHSFREVMEFLTGD